ncbi:hypothetical protein N7474_006631 [Penicillium riverlandense]|uniref:uncharacterized protein n=1 Tax=Penicillium riverlandense TaxID=1903569 RepID=UPI0025485F5E|nr:uncharacterized protein N7474_006631 [Penicillium riverlandense]KAJ5814854.1 hypothetical protein N7474_006631 [Penicillium riverlandense]
MPADYQSTAQALALPISSDSPSPDDDAQPPWTRARWSSERATTFRDQLINRGTELSNRVYDLWMRMSLLQKVGTVTAAVAMLTLAIVFMVFTGKLFLWLGPVAEKWENSALVGFILWLCVFFVSFPPLVGWSTFGTVLGFIFGTWKGWLIYATASVLGSTCSFVVSRTVLSKFVNRMMERDTRFAALALTLKYDGLKLLCMIRLCPLPYSICNGAVSTFPTVQPLMYGLATAIITPKLLVPTFIGSRVRLLSDKNEEMSAASKAINICSILVTVSIGIFTGWYIYQRTLARAKELEAKERADIRQSLQADHAAHRPHGSFSDDSDVNAASKTLARDEEERIGFGDFDDDHVDLELGDDSDSDRSPRQWKSNRRSYHDEFTDNDSDGYEGTSGEAYGLHRHISE